MKPPRVHEGQTTEALEAELAASLETDSSHLNSSTRQPVNLSFGWNFISNAPQPPISEHLILKLPHIYLRKSDRSYLSVAGVAKGGFDTRCPNRDIEFIPTDVSEPLAQTAAQLAQKNNIPTGTPLIFDLAANNAAQFLQPHAGQPRLFTFFGIIPISPTLILPKVRSLMENNDHLLASANLAPNGMEPILEQYDNTPTRRWLEQFLTEHEISGGILQIKIRRQDHIEWFQADYIFEADTQVSIGAAIQFASGTALQLFVSHRYTPHSATKVFAEHGLCISQTFLSENQEEGVFLCHPQ